MKHIDVSFFSDFDKVEKKLSFKLMGINRNKQI